MPAVPDFIQIIGGNHIPPHPFMIVNRFGMHVDLSKVTGGTLWDDTVARIVWGLRDDSGRRYGVIYFKNGAKRVFSWADLMEPYIKAWKSAKGVVDAQQAAQKAAKEKAAAK